MIEGSFFVTPALTAWLAKEKKSITIKVNSKGCNGNTIFYELEDDLGDQDVWLDFRVMELIERGLKLEIDYIEEPLFQRVHINVLNKDKCGCGKSFNI
jgi:Fe-S cluster assembly iron-binding protein IscA